MDNGTNSVEVTADRQFEFVEEYIDWRIKNSVYSDGERPRLFIRGIFQAAYHQWYLHQGISVAITEPGTLVNWKNQSGQYNSEEGSGLVRTFSYKTDNPKSRADLLNILENVAPDSFYVWVWTLLRDDTGDGIDLHPEDWAADSIQNGGKNIFNVLEAQGATRVRDMETKGSLPYIIMYQKGVGVIDEDLAPDITGNAFTDAVFRRSYRDGAHRSVDIGPAREWKEVRWQYGDFQFEHADDFVSLRVMALNSTKTDTLIVADTLTGPLLDISSLDAREYPYLILELNSYNRARKAPQLDYWNVSYTPFPDLIVNPSIDFEFDGDTLVQGQTLVLSTGIENVGTTPMENTFMQVSLSDKNNQTTSEMIDVPSLLPGESTSIRYENETFDKKGNYSLFVELNPNIKPEDQFENNTGVLEFFIQSDELNPLLDITFDGVHIQDGDLVSAKPFIELSLKDENEYFALDDTSNISLFIKYPFEFEYRQISLASSEIQFYPGDLNSGENEMRIEYTPTFFEDGIYELKAEAKDALGNISGAAAYAISFEVMNERKISSFTNFPNPFRTSTRFVYTLTGDQVPDQFMIQIYAMSGQLVREITPGEIGELRVGSHMTDYAWDGSDQNGEQLESGIYLYRVIAKNADGSDYEKYNTGIGQFIQKDFGKLIIIR